MAAPPCQTSTLQLASQTTVSKLRAVSQQLDAVKFVVIYPASYTDNHHQAQSNRWAFYCLNEYKRQPKSTKASTGQNRQL